MCINDIVAFSANRYIPEDEHIDRSNCKVTRHNMLHIQSPDWDQTYAHTVTQNFIYLN